MKKDGTHELNLTSRTKDGVVEWSLDCTDCTRQRPALKGDSGKQILVESRDMHEKTTRSLATIERMKKERR